MENNYITNNSEYKNNLANDVYYRYNLTNKFLINEKDFENLLNLYKFKLEPNKKYIIDKKRREVIGQGIKNLFDKNKYDIFFSSDWIFSESCANKNEVVVNILKSYPTLAQYYKKFNEKLEKDRKRLEKYNARWSLKTKIDDVDTFWEDYLDD